MEKGSKCTKAYWQRNKCDAPSQHTFIIPAPPVDALPYGSNMVIKSAITTGERSLELEPAESCCSMYMRDAA